jgi:hypothetical protein
MPDPFRFYGVRESSDATSAADKSVEEIRISGYTVVVGVPSEKNQRGIVASAGSVLGFDSMIFHRAGYNRSALTRRALNHVYTLPFLKQQISIPEALQGKFRDGGLLAKFLGYDSEPGKNVSQWRAAKIERTREST